MQYFTLQKTDLHVWAKVNKSRKWSIVDIIKETTFGICHGTISTVIYKQYNNSYL